MTARRIVVGLVLCGGLATCTFDGLDQYASGGDVAADVGGDVEKDASDASDAGGQCGCGANECIGGECVTCSASWTQTFPAVQNNRHLVDPASFRMYWSGSRPNDAGGSAYLASIDTCTGKVVKTADPPMVANSPPFGNAGHLALTSGKLVVAIDKGWATMDPVSLGGLVANPFDTNGGTIRFTNATKAGAIWTAGYTSQSTLWVTRGDGTGATPCTETPATNQVAAAQSVVVSGTTAFVMYGSNGNAYVSAYDDTACATQCPCAPLWTTSPIAVGTAADGIAPTYGVVVGDTLYIAGYVAPTNQNWHGFVTYLTISSHAWGPLSQPFDPTTGTDGFTGLAVSGNTVYAAGATNFTTSAVHGVVVSYTLPTLGSPVTVVDSTAVAPIWTIDIDAQNNLYVSGENGVTSGIAAKCAGTSCP